LAYWFRNWSRLNGLFLATTQLGAGTPLAGTAARSTMSRSLSDRSRAGAFHPAPVAGSKKWLAAWLAGTSASAAPAVSHASATCRPRASGTEPWVGDSSLSALVSAGASAGGIVSGSNSPPENPSATRRLWSRDASAACSVSPACVVCGSHAEAARGITDGTRAIVATSAHRRAPRIRLAARRLTCHRPAWSAAAA
jgi:hypothetical protein